MAAVLALSSLTLPGVVYTIGLGYAAFALLGPSDKRDLRLRLAAGAFAALLMLTVLVDAAATVRYASITPDDPTYVALNMGVASIILSMIMMVLMIVAAILAATSFTRQGRERYRLLSASGLCLVFYYVLLLPGAVAESHGAPALGSYWADPLTFGGLALGLLASAAIACAYLWAGAAADGSMADAGLRFGRAQREYLLAVGAFSLVLPNLISLATADWGALRQRADETLSDAVYVGLVLVSSLLYLVVLFGVATAAFWISSRQAGWKPSHWLAPRGAETVRTETAAAAAPKPLVRIPLAWAMRFLLTWRLLVFYGWIIVLVAACSFVGWWGFVSVLPAAAVYLWMLGRTQGGSHAA